MAYGSKNNRKKILSSIVEGADGGSIMGALEASMKEEDNRSRGRGAVSAAKSLEDTYEKVSSMKRSLGEQTTKTNEAINKSRSSDSSIAKDWMTVLSGQAEADKPANDIKRSEMLARRMADPQTDDDKFLRTGKEPMDVLDVPYVPSDNPDDAPITYSGDQAAGASGRTAAIDAALKKALGEDEEDGPLSPDDMPITRANTDFPSRIGMDLNDNTEGEGLMTRPKARPSSITAETKDFEIPEYKVFDKPSDMSDLEILARTIEAEASGEEYTGKIAVGAVIANRASSGSYGSSGGIKGVILKKAQFSPWNSFTGGAKGEQGKDMMALKASDDSYRAANAILTGGYTDPTNGSTHYVNESAAQGQEWISIMKSSKKGTIMIGNHLFGNADNNKVYDGRTGSIQRIVGTKSDGQFGPATRKKALTFLKSKGLDVTEETSNEDLMQLIVAS